MARLKVDNQTRKTLLQARAIMEAIAKKDANEAETRSRVEWCFESLMGYDKFTHIIREHIVHGVGDADYCDFAIQLAQGDKVKPVILVEIKKINIDLSQKHLKQVASYAINVGCEWLVLTNGRDWQLHHVSFGQPPQTTLLDTWNLMTDDLSILAEKFDLIGYKSVKRDSLNQLWQKSSVLTPHNILKVILSETCVAMIRRELKKEAGIALSLEEIVGAVRYLLNESAVAELETVKISLSGKQRRRRRLDTTVSTEKLSESSAENTAG